jgi:hypothetical protein
LARDCHHHSLFLWPVVRAGWVVAGISLNGSGPASGEPIVLLINPFRMKKVIISAIIEAAVAILTAWANTLLTK